MDINKVAIKVSIKTDELERQKNNISDKESEEYKLIEKRITNLKLAFETLKTAAQPFICLVCDGSGQERFSDAAGSRDYRPCKNCKSSGIDINC